MVLIKLFGIFVQKLQTVFNNVIYVELFKTENSVSMSLLWIVCRTCLSAYIFISVLHNINNTPYKADKIFIVYNH